MKFDAQYWSDRYQQNQMGWDTGGITTPLKEYIDQLVDKDVAILIPGCGNGYEARYLYDRGFTNVTVIDLAEKPLLSLSKYCRQWPTASYVKGDFFDLAGLYDLIIEQTFFCALNPELRRAYAQKMHTLLKPGGKLVGVLFNIPLGTQGPPFGGDKEEYLEYFTELFEIALMEPCHNSIKPRAGNELFIKLIKPA